VAKKTAKERLPMSEGYLEFAYGNEVRVKEDYLYHPNGCWAIEEENGLIRVGVTDYLQATGGMVLITEINEAGCEVEQDGELGTIEARKPEKKAKSVIGLVAPLSGVIKEVNENMEEDASQINHDPYGEGWICRIEPANWAIEKQALMDAETYFTFIQSKINKK